MMRKLAVIIIAGNIFVGHSASSATVDDRPVGSVLAKFIDDVVRPRYDLFGQSTASLYQSFQTLCASPGEATLKETKLKFSNTAIAWANVEMARIGPVIADNRFERILFYPDRKGTGLRHTQKILGKEDKRALSIDTLQKKSVATQGLGALEFLLFGTGAEQLATTEAAFRCGYGRTISENLNIIAGEIVDEWQKPGGISTQWKNPGVDNPLFQDSNEVLNEILGLLVNNMKIVHGIRVGAFLGKTSEDDRPRRAIYRRSQMTFASITENIKALKALFVDSGISKLLPENVASIEDSVLFEFNQAINTSASITLPVEQALLDDVQRGKIEYLSLVLDSLAKRLDEDFAPATGLAAGFSFSDGD